MVEQEPPSAIKLRSSAPGVSMYVSVGLIYFFDVAFIVVDKVIEAQFQEYCYNFLNWGRKSKALKCVQIALAPLRLNLNDVVVSIILHFDMPPWTQEFNAASHYHNFYGVVPSMFLLLKDFFVVDARLIGCSTT